MTRFGHRPVLRELKRIVTIERFLQERGIQLRQRGDRLVGPCPLHGGDNQNAFVVSPDKNLWYCFTGCSSGGDIVELVRRLDGSDYRHAAIELARIAAKSHPCPSVNDATSLDRIPRSRDHRYTAPIAPFTRKLRLDPCTPWLGRKGIKPATARRFEVGAYYGRGMLARCIAVRLHDTDGRPVGYAGRRLDEEEIRRAGKWRFPPKITKSALLYGYHFVIAERPLPIAVVECPWGVLRFAQIQIPAVALLGATLYEPQRQLLLRARHIVLVMDADIAGRRAAEQIAQQLANRVKVSTVQLPDGCDPDDLPESELRAAVSTYFLS